MNFDLGPHELALRDGIRELCLRRFPIERVREGFDRDAWRTLGEAGVFSLRLPEDQGGVGLGMTEAVIVFQELGRALVPGPLVASHLAAGIAEGAATGERVVTLYDDSGVIEFGTESDLAMSILDDKVFLLSDPGGAPLDPLDPLTPIVRHEGSVNGQGVLANGIKLRREGTALSAALSSGIASRTVELAVAYAMQREQFGKPIGTFQAIKHICADMLVRAEVARCAVDAAGVLLDEDDPSAGAAVAGAKLLSSEAAIANAKACIQVHGGMGFTWEVDAHLYLKRAAVLATSFGGIDAQAELVATSL